ncbi:restriction endonuclease subunit S [uncultured Actinomyces sp.]|uniref:restriction endonuclease subunit S n=1 Tax=uncultured Actinomyces sp. TaxID=249061 RepID=UPI0028EE7413|nr:restriction endonuclease subunit S [uncultured Actinomyces sp.]
MIADRLRAAILHAAISGKLTDQRPEDGTAKDLLEQIAAERAVLAKAKKLQKQKDLHPVTEDTQPFVLPASWKWVRFQDVSQFRIGKTPKKAEPKYWSPSEIPWVAISDMTQGGSITSTKQGVSAVAIAECYGGQLSPAGTLIMSFKLTIGRCSFLGRDAVHNEAIVSIFPAASAGDSFSRYLSHALPLLSQLGDSKAAIKGNTLNSESIANLPIPLPPPMEQERIVAKLDEVLPLIDQLAELERERESI